MTELSITDIEEKFGLNVATAVADNRNKDPIRRRYDKVFTRPVMEMLYRKHIHTAAPFPMSLEELAAENGLIPVSYETIKNWLLRYDLLHSNLNIPPTEPEIESSGPDLMPPPDWEEDTALSDVDEEIIKATSHPPRIRSTIRPDDPIKNFPLLQLQLQKCITELNQIPGVTAIGSVSFSWTNTKHGEEANGTH